MSLQNKITQAYARIKSHIIKTPLIYSPQLSEKTNANVYFKLENLQHTSSFKVRGAFNKLLSLSAAERDNGVAVASSGNHGAAVAYALKQLDAKGLLFLPENTSNVKIQAIKSYGAEPRFHGKNCGDTESFARHYAEKNKLAYISPYNDIDVVAGQGTMAVELEQQLKNIDAVFVSVGGGGMISGVGAYLKSISPKTKIIGCLPENSPVMAESIKAGYIVEMPAKLTLSDGTAGGIEKGAITFKFCQQYVDNFVLVTEDEIKQSMRAFIESEHQLLEGAAGVAFAAFLKTKNEWLNRDIVIVVCGANINLVDLRSVLNNY